MVVVERGAPTPGALVPFFAVGGARGVLFLVVVARSVAMRFPAALLAALLAAVDRATCNGGATGLTSTGISPSSSAFPTRLASPNRSNTCRRSSLSDLIGDSCGSKLHVGSVVPYQWELRDDSSPSLVHAVISPLQGVTEVGSQLAHAQDEETGYETLAKGQWRNAIASATPMAILTRVSQGNAS
ncbi:hypothetical protein F2Q68_00007243 [Brassica cretica]|uniref:Uncharacterized protein n=1 Tax=Brassica cretica TaxID=69181 RepID=A0A8S9KSN2_BRACR|nr:hypothetical protein F2Q68_00007243 [Brassica cretica]